MLLGVLPTSTRLEHPGSGMTAMRLTRLADITLDPQLVCQLLHCCFQLVCYRCIRSLVRSAQLYEWLLQHMRQT